MFTREELAQDLGLLGVAHGDALFVHSSFRSLGPVAGGAETVIRAMEDALGETGLLLMPSFNLVTGGHDARARSWDRATSSSTVGWLTEYFRRMPGTYRSDHYSHSVAARGRDARRFVSGHRRREGMASPWDLPPWGRTYGGHSPFMKAYRDPRACILMLGVGYHSATFCHLVEVMWWNRRRRANPEAEYCWLDRDKAGAWWDAHGPLRRGRVGHAACRLFRVREFVDGVLEQAEARPALWFKWYPGATQ